MVSLGDIQIECDECCKMIRVSDAELVQKRIGNTLVTVEICYTCSNKREK